MPSLADAVGSSHEYSIAGSLFDVFIAGNGLWFLMALFVGEIVVYVTERAVVLKQPDEADRQRSRLFLGVALVAITQVRSAFFPIPFDPFQMFAGMRAAGFMLVALALKNEVFSAGNAGHCLIHALESAACLVFSVLAMGSNVLLDVFLKMVSAFSGGV